jgi:ABC-type uncharacterized transport system fused permease/ATPase subunit
MIERPPPEIASATSEIDTAANAGLMPQLGMMGRALLASPVRRRQLLPAVAVLLVIAITTYGQIRLNSWNKPGAGAYSSALARLGLQRLEPLLNESRRWDRVLSQDEQQRLAFASLVLHARAGYSSTTRSIRWTMARCNA